MTEREQQLLDLFNNLSEQDAHSLLRFAQFLAGQEKPITSSPVEVAAEDETITPVIPEPEKIPRPSEERVVDALKRLSVPQTARHAFDLLAPLGWNVKTVP